MSGSGGPFPRAPLPPHRAGGSQGAPAGDTQTPGFASPPASPKCVKDTSPRSEDCAGKRGPPPAPRSRSAAERRCRAPVTPAGRTRWGAAPGLGQPGSPRVNPPSPAGPSMVKLRVNEWRGSPGGCQPPPPPPRAGIPGPSAPPGPQRVNSVRAGPSADVFGLCCWERKRPSEGGISPLAFKGKTRKKREVRRSRAPEPALCWSQPWCGTGDPSVCAGGQLAGTVG